MVGYKIMVVVIPLANIVIHVVAKVRKFSLPCSFFGRFAGDARMEAIWGKNHIFSAVTSGAR